MEHNEATAVAARAVVDQHGENALYHAKRMARRYTKAGDRSAAREWLQIMREIGTAMVVRAEKCDQRATAQNKLDPRPDPP